MKNSNMMNIYSRTDDACIVSTEAKNKDIQLMDKDACIVSTAAFCKRSCSILSSHFHKSRYYNILSIKNILIILLSFISISLSAQTPVASYPFNGNANDESGSNDGTENGGVSLTSDRFGNANSAYSFDGSNDYILTQSNNFLDNYNIGTIAFWAKFNETASTQTILTYSTDESVNSSYNFTIQNTKIYVSLKHGTNGYTPFLTGTTTLNPNEWYCFVIQSDGVNLNKVFINTQDELLTFDNSLSQSTGNDWFSDLNGVLDFNHFINIGAFRRQGTAYENNVNGIIDDIKLYDQALTPTQIKQLYANYHAPTNIKVEANTTTEFKLSWDSTYISNIAKYRIYRDLELYDSVIVNSNTDTVFYDSFAYSGTQYKYFITSVDDYGNESQHSDTLTETSNFEVPLFTEMTSIVLQGVSTGSVAWGDYDNDDDLDILLTGSDISKIYKNESNSNFIEMTSINIIGVSESSVAWGDFNNDSDLDILLTGHNTPSTYSHSKIYKNNGNSSFMDKSDLSLINVHRSAVAWSDFNNDGVLDILLTGDNGAISRISKIYINGNHGIFSEQTSISLKDVNYSAVACGDYDNDNDNDILITGRVDDGVSAGKAILYKNSNNSFIEESNVPFAEVYQSSVTWGDYDHDGDLDCLLSGTSDMGAGAYSKIYKNDGDGLFGDVVSANLNKIYKGSVKWGDYDNDGDLDILLSGQGAGDPNSTLIYRNDGLDNFSGVFENIFAIVHESSVAWADYDNDGDLDILLSGESDSGPISKIYRNNSQTKNTLPQAPTALTSNPNADSVLFSWTAATDNETPSPGLSYNVFVRSATDTIVMPHSNPVTGYVKIPEMGNAQLGTEFLLKELGAGTYYWKVQAVDNCFAGGAWSTESSFTIASAPEITAVQSSLDFGQCTANSNYNLSFKIVNTGNDSLSINSISNLSEPYGTNFSSAVKIGKQDTTEITVTFNPTATGYFYDTLIINSDAVNQPALKIPLKGFVATNACAGGIVIGSNTTWIKANSPYLVSCNLAIDAGVTLTIEPGVTVVIDTAKQISIDGTIKAIGTKTDSILFTNNGDTASNARYNQLYFRTGSTAEFAYFKIENATNGINTEGTFASLKHGALKNCEKAFKSNTDSLTIDSCYFSKNQYGIDVSGNTEMPWKGKGTNPVAITNSTFYKNSYGINAGNALFEITKCTFTNNSSYGIYTSNENSACKISNCTFNANAIGARIFRINPFENNTITNSTNYGIYADDCTIAFCTISDNTGNGVELINTTIQNCQVFNNGTNGIASTSAWPVTISKNNIYSNGEAGIYATARPTVSHNNIYANGSYNLHATQQGTDTLHAENNYWGVTGITEIRATIYDYYDDGTTIRVDFDPYASDTIHIIAAPSNLQAIAQGMTQINLSWTDNSDDETGFVLERSTTAESGFAEIETTLANVTNYADTGLNSSTTYYYRIKAINAKGASEYAEFDSVATESLFQEMNSINLTGVRQSAVSWGDYDNDNDLDLLLTGSEQSIIYKNESNNDLLKQASINLLGIDDGSVDWGDYDNDGNIDILLAGGSMANTERNTIVYRNTGINDFIEQSDLNLLDIQGGSVDWGDYNNDGAFDILIAGAGQLKVYKNTRGDSFVEQSDTNLVGASSSAVSWGDCNNDGKLDFVVSGQTSGGAKTNLYVNDSNRFVKDNLVSLFGFQYGTTEWGDYNNDGLLDLVISGAENTSMLFYTKVYKNTGSVLEEQIKYNLHGPYAGSTNWGDYDNDGYLDLLVSGDNSTKLYSYDVINDVFHEKVNLDKIQDSDCAWADYDNDGDLDILITGSGISKIYRNNTTKKNTPPNPPTNLSATLNEDGLQLNWDAATDNETPSLGLNYNIFMRGPDGSMVTAPMADTVTGYRRIVERGHIQTTFWKMDTTGMAHGRYYWKVQAIDAAFAGGAWSQMGSFTLSNNASPVLTLITPAADSMDVDTVGVSLVWTGTDAEGEAISYDVYFGTDENPPLVSENQSESTYALSNINAATTYYWKVEAEDAFGNITTSPTQKFKTWVNDAPYLTLVSPSNGNSGGPLYVDLIWSATDDENDAITYDVYFESVGNSSKTVTNYTDTVLHIDTLSYGQTYIWQVTAHDSYGNDTVSEKWSFSIDGNDKPELTLVAPRNDSTGGPLNVNLIWMATDDENDDITFDVYFESVGNSIKTVTNYTDTVLHIDTLSYGQTYIWQVTAHDTYGNDTISNKWSFTIDQNDAPIINLLSPANDSTNTPIAIWLKWNASDDENEELNYTINYAESSGANAQTISNHKTDSIEISELKRNTTYKWSVIAADTYGNSTPSQEFSFTTTALEAGWLQLTVSNNVGQPLQGASYEISSNEKALYTGETNTDGKSDILYFEKDTYKLNLNREGYFHVYNNNVQPVTDDTTEITIQMKVIGDYNNDGSMNQDDLDYLVEDWHKENPEMEMGPVSGTAPNFTVEPDGVIDFEDLMVFGQMWRYTNNNKSATIVTNKNDSWHYINSLRILGQVFESNNLLTLKLWIDGDGEINTGRLLIKYNSEVLKYIDAVDIISSQLSGISYIDHEKDIIEINTGLFQECDINKKKPYFEIVFNTNDDVVLPDISYEIHQPANQASTGKVSFANDVMETMIYPNPADQYLIVESAIILDKITITDVTGRKVKQVEAEQLLTKINISEYENGILIITLESNDKVEVKKIIKE